MSQIKDIYVCNKPNPHEIPVTTKNFSKKASGLTAGHHKNAAWPVEIRLDLLADHGARNRTWDWPIVCSPHSDGRPRVVAAATV